MLLTKSNHSQTIPMKKHDEDAFYSISYLITQLCLYKNQYIPVFYGRFSDVIFPVTEKPNRRDETIEKPKEKFLTEKANFKTARLHPTAPKSRPNESHILNFEIIPSPKQYHQNQLITFAKESISKPCLKTRIPSKDLPMKTTYRKVFLTKSFFKKLQYGIENLSQNEYSSYDIKYKVIHRLVRLCSKMNLIESISESIRKCLCSNLYSQIFTTIESTQIRFAPKQLFFIYECSQFIIRHDFTEQDKFIIILCPIMISKTKLIIEQVLNSDNSPSHDDKGLARQALSYHLELLNYLSLTSIGRQEFLQSSISKIAIDILNTETLLTIACNNEEFFHANIRIILYTLLLLCNLAYEKTIFKLLKNSNLKYIKTLNEAKGSAIQFASNALSMILNEENIDEEYEPKKLKQAYFKHIQDNPPEPKHVNITDGETYNNENLHVKYTVLTQKVLDKLIDDIKHILENSDDLNDNDYKRVSQRLRACIKQNTSQVECLLQPVINCLMSQFYMNVFQNIELYKGKLPSSVISINRPLAFKCLFFMRDCPEFLIEHHYLENNDEDKVLMKMMLNNTKIIFEQHLSVITDEIEIHRPRRLSINGKAEGRIEALSYHIKLLNHFAMQRSFREEFNNQSIVENLIDVLQNNILLVQIEHLNIKTNEFIRQSLYLLNNLILVKQIMELMKKKNVILTCLKLSFINDKIIQFISQLIFISLDKNSSENLRDIPLLSKTYIEYIRKSTKVPKLSYHSVKLSCLIRNLNIIILQNELFRDAFVEEKNSISTIANCVCAYQEEDENSRLRRNKSLWITDKMKPDAEVLEKI
ncbi:unnamed protein product [Adineta steineri]|uniref:Uncharacterized protein n=1 Tax=Adineta steineri TaxID=433720 RepID=A0A815ZJ87_9BILA|nr:unnamed protein product [Adineta steineri]CAF1584210.1 unnamed protein product [Adineta steineri]